MIVHSYPNGDPVEHAAKCKTNATRNVRAPEGLDLLSQDDLIRAMSDNPHMGCPDAGCDPDCPARIYPA